MGIRDIFFLFSNDTMIEKKEDYQINQKKNQIETVDLPLQIFGLSIRGSSHDDADIPCQDACEYRIINGTKGVISIADGLGSAPHSDAGQSIVFNMQLISFKKDMLKPI